tara:strand:+ start:82 stop:396 length:315 start_codon:yes stop_codon:yes gene_type:complete
MKPNKVETIISDLVKHMKNEGLTNKENMLNYTHKEYFKYDRSNFMRAIGNNFKEEENIYQGDIASLSTEIVQMVLYGHIIYERDNIKDIRAKKKDKQKERITER